MSNAAFAVNHERLGDLFEFQNGRGFKKSEWSQQGLPIIRIQNLNDPDASFNRFRGTYSEDILVSAGDLLFSWSGTVGSSFGPHIWQGEQGVLNQHIFKVLPKKEIDVRYAFYALEQITQDIEKEVSGSVGLVHITKKRLNEFTIPAPPLPEQRRIVVILDEAFEGIAAAKANAEKNLRNARDAIQSHVDGLFGEHSRGSDQPLKAIASTQYGYTESASSEPIGPRFLRITDIQDGVVDWETVPYCQIDEADLPAYLLRDGDIVFARTGATTGKSFLVRSPPESVFASYLIRLRPTTKEVIPEFLSCFFMTSRYWQAIKVGSTGSAQGGFNATKLGGLRVPMPPVAEQRRIVASAERMVTQSSALADMIARKLASLDELKASLLHQAFTGQL